MVGALQCEYVRDPVLLLRNRAPIYFFPHSQARLLGNYLSWGQHWRQEHLWLESCCTSVLTVTSLSCGSLCRCSLSPQHNRSWQWLKKPESALVLRMVFGRLMVLWECSINHERNVAGSSRQLSFSFVCVAG